MVSGAARGTRDEGGRTKNRRQETEDRSIRAGEKEEIHIMKPSFCAEGLWPAAVGGDYLVNLLYYALRPLPRRRSGHGSGEALQRWRFLHRSGREVCKSSGRFSFLPTFQPFFLFCFKLLYTFSNGQTFGHCAAKLLYGLTDFSSNCPMCTVCLIFAFDVFSA